jgi:mannan endo-1,4-beta-mannosidase
MSMRAFRHLRRVGAVAFLVAPCVDAGASAQTSGPIDPRATRETRNLFENVRALAQTRVMFGHQDDLAYGHDWIGEEGRSDVRDVSGSYPAVHGWDVSKLEQGASHNIDSVSFANMRRWIVDVYRRGGVNTVSWHLDNPATGGNAWDTTAAVASILPGGVHHAEYRTALDRLAAFFQSLRVTAGRQGELVPIVFRPFHEMNGAWFWWGARHATADDYRRLWRYTVEYLRDTKGVHNLLYAYSPNVGGPRGYDNYLDFFPGDAYVDVLGLDEYFWPPTSDQADPVSALNGHLAWMVKEAESRGKIAALTETGYETIPDSLWWTRQLLPAITRGTDARRIAWVLVWRNGNRARMRRDHFYAPFRGQASAPDFLRFRHDSLILFESDLPPLYRERGAGVRRGHP